MRKRVVTALAVMLAVCLLIAVLYLRSPTLEVPQSQPQSTAPAVDSEAEQQETEQPKAGQPEAEHPGARRLEVELVLQEPELRNGCEAASLTMVLRYLGYPAEMLVMAYAYIPRQDFEIYGGYAVCGHPNEVYPGNPAEPMGFYCYPPVVKAGANLYLSLMAGEHRAYDISGAGEEDLVRHLDEGWPLVLWKTTNQKALNPREDLAWTLSGSGEVYVPYDNIHVVVLSGYDECCFYLHDPFGYEVTIKRDKLMENYDLVGRRAVLIKTQ